MSGTVAVILVGLGAIVLGGFAWFFSDDIADSQYRKERDWAFLLNQKLPDEEETTRRWSGRIRALGQIQAAIGGVIASAGAIW